MMTTDILITDGCLLPEPGTDRVTERGYVAIRGGRIAALGDMADLGPVRAREVVDAGGAVVMPGLVNCHCHAAMTLFRGLADDLALGEWLGEHIFPAESRHVNPEMVYWCSRLAAAEMLLSGTTLVADGYFFADAAARAFGATGLRAVAAQGVIDFPAPGVPDPADNVRVAARFLDAWHLRDRLVTPAVFAHSPYTCAPETLQRAKQEAGRRGRLFFIHTAETEGEPALIQDRRGASPIRHLDALGLLDPLTVCVHCVWVDEEDIAILVRRGARAVLCPQSHLKLASGIAPLAALRAQGVVVGLGTDSAASNNSLDMFREMDVCAKVQKAWTGDPVAVPAKSILRMATGEGAEVLGFGGCGVLRPGAPADVILVDRNSPHLTPFYGPDLLVYGTRGSDVRTVIVDGRPVVRDGRLLTTDLDAVMARVRALAARAG
ncbi:MAG TPA: amidohydrolase [Desulfobacteraceae bacterium]|nr:amidohydrolase [Desulfobacteraceae bacterium]